MASYDKIIDNLLNEMNSLPYIRSKDIPNIDLYMDQVTTFMEERLSPTRRFESDKIITKTMINNYAKNKLLPPPKGKKYTKEHIILLVFIYYFKGFLSLQDIQALTGPILKRRDRPDAASDLLEIYHTVFSDIENQVESARKSMHEYARISDSMFDDDADEDQKFLRMFSLVSMIGVDIYVRKRLMEELIDSYSKE